MLRNNLLCGPEMSFGTSESEPHAYVSYEDGERETVPLAFIVKFPTAWRTAGWDHNYLFKVFWSPIPEDSPRKALKRLPEIPVFDRGVTSSKLGYYRATVLLAADSLAELTEKMSNKRCITNRSGNYTSFDKKASPKKVSKKQSKKKIVGIHQQAQTHNTSDLRELIKKRIGHSDARDESYVDASQQVGEGAARKTESHDPYEEEDPTGKEKKKGDNSKRVIKDDDIASGRSDGDSAHSDTCIQKPENNANQRASSFNTGSKSSVKRKLLVSPTEEKEKLAPVLKRPFRNSAKNLSTIDSTDDSEYEIGNKKLKLDPDFTPRKYELQKTELNMKNQTIKRLRDLNVHHQEKMIQYEKKIQDLEFEISELQGKLKKLEKITHQSSGSHHNSSTVDRKKSTSTAGSSHNSVRSDSKKFPTEDGIGSSKRPTGSSQKPAPHAAQKLQVAECEDTDNHKFGEKLVPSSTEKGKLSSKKSAHGVQSDLLNNDKDSTPREPSKVLFTDDWDNDDNDDNDPNRISPLNVCETTYNNASDDEPSCDKGETEEEECNKGLVEGVTASQEIWEFIKDIKSGEKGDLRFVKDLAIVVFGPEVLASSSIKGTKRGPKNKTDGEPTQRPPLDEEKLKKVYDCLVKRVAKEVGGVNKEELKKTNPRLTTARFHSALRQVQKRVRSVGYGQNKKSNEVTVDLLAER